MGFETPNERKKNTHTQNIINGMKYICIKTHSPWHKCKYRYFFTSNSNSEQLDMFNYFGMHSFGDIERMHIWCMQSVIL